MLSLRNILHNGRNMILSLRVDFGHSFWVIDKEEDIKLSQKLSAMPALYIADGHHRSAAAALVGAEKRSKMQTIREMRITITLWLYVSRPTS